MNEILKLDINEIVIYIMYILLIWQCRHIIFGLSRGVWDAFFGDDEEYK